MTEDELELEAAGFFLIEIDGEFDVEKQLQLVMEAADNELHIPGVTLWQPVENYNAKEILYEIESLKQLLERVYERGKTSR